MIENSIGSYIFKNLYMEIDGQKKDVLKNGLLSCAVFVSGILYMNKMINGMHATVNSTVKDLEKSGWIKINEPERGDILVWELYKWPGDIEEHEHIGFYVGEDMAISNDSKIGSPQKHHFTYGIEESKPVRKIIAVYRFAFERRLL